MHNWKYMAVCGLTAAVLLAGCGKVDGTQAAITVDGETINLGTAAFEMRYQQAETTSAMEMYGLISQGATLWDQSYEAEDGEGTITYGDEVKDSIKESLAKSVLLRKHAADYGIEMPENVIEALDEAAKATYEANADVLAGIGTTQEDVRSSMELGSYATLLYEAMTEDTDTEVSDEEAAQTTVSYARIYFTSGDEEASEENLEETKKKDMELMQELLDKLLAEEDQAGVDFSTLADEVDSSIVTGSTSYGADEEILPKEVTDAVASLKDGEIASEIIETENYYYIARLDAAFDEHATEHEKENIIETRKRENYEAKLQEWLDAAEITTSAAWDALKIEDSDAWTVKHVQ